MTKAAFQIDIGRSEGQRGYHNNKPLVKSVQLVKMFGVIQLLHTEFKLYELQ